MYAYQRERGPSRNQCVISLDDTDGAYCPGVMGFAARAAAVIAAVTAASLAGTSRALAVNECGPLTLGGVDCKSAMNPAIAAGITYTDPAAVTINMGGGAVVLAAPLAGVTATAGGNATVNAAGGVSIVAAGGAGYLITGGLNATANLSAGSNIGFVGGAGVVVTGGLNASVNAATGVNIAVALGAGYVVTSLGAGPVGGAIVNVGGETNAVGAGIVATSLLGFANVSTASTSQINAGGAGIIATGGVSTTVSQGGPINAAGAGIIASVIGIPSVPISKVSVSWAGRSSQSATV